MSGGGLADPGAIRGELAPCPVKTCTYEGPHYHGTMRFAGHEPYPPDTPTQAARAREEGQTYAVEGELELEPKCNCGRPDGFHHVSGCAIDSGPSRDELIDEVKRLRRERDSHYVPNAVIGEDGVPRSSAASLAAWPSQR